MNVGRATLVPTGKEGREGDLSREQLSHDVRDRRFEAFDRSIDVHIASLRKKLGDDLRAARFIRTVRGAGYQLLDPSAEP